VNPRKRKEIAMTKVLLVDDDPMVMMALDAVLGQKGFDITSASNVPDALRLISANTYDALVSDLHMPGHGDGLTVISAMRHANPKAATILLSAFPEMGAASRAILAQADEVMVKPAEIDELVRAIVARLKFGPLPPREIESVATILERSAEGITSDWYSRIESEEEIMAIPMTREVRCAHLPQLFRDLVLRLRSKKQLGARALASIEAKEHGIARRKQGYTAAMLVEESRQLQVCLFLGLQDNNASLDFSLVLLGVMTIADEIDSQLSQQIACYVAESVRSPLHSAA
jgi:CheY-like chemotaxis protein